MLSIQTPEKGQEHIQSRIKISGAVQRSLARHHASGSAIRRPDSTWRLVRLVEDEWAEKPAWINFEDFELSRTYLFDKT